MTLGGDSVASVTPPSAPARTGEVLPISYSPSAPTQAPFDPLRVPPTWEASSRWAPEIARNRWREFAADNQDLWPELPVAYELSQVGLYELAGPILAEVYAEVRDLRKNKRKQAWVGRWRSSGGKETSGKDEALLERWSTILGLKMNATSWRMIFGAAGYPASVAMFALEDVGFYSYSRQEPEGRAVWTLSYPAAFAPHVWRTSWEHDIDPLLMLAVMRVESRYRHDAVSFAGAMGLIQVMPATGHRVAALMGDPDFRVDRLLEPEVNIRLGTFYMGRLMDRFGESQFALAVGSYNGGPHNIGRWLNDKAGMPFEEFVEEIQFDETRKYVKRVIEYYEIYCQLYGEGAWVVLPERTHADDRSGINF